MGNIKQYRRTIHFMYLMFEHKQSNASNVSHKTMLVSHSLCPVLIGAEA